MLPAVNRYPAGSLALLILALLTAPAGRLAAQNVLFADYDGKFYPVLRARGNSAFVKISDKLVVADGRQFALKPAKDYLPVFVAVRNLAVKTSYLNMNGSALNHEFHFRGTLETPYRLEDVFIVLELETESAGKMLFLQEVGQLNPRDPKAVAIVVPTSSGLGTGHYHFHLFAQGIEVLQSEIPPLLRDAAVDRMIAARLPAGPDAVPQFFIGPEPEYPAALLAAKTKGQVVISIRIGTSGQVYDPAVKSATDPAFGESALAAMRLWRFLPRMKGGRPVEARVDVPFNFSPPEKKP
jgi:TonB family protein